MLKAINWTILVASIVMAGLSAASVYFIAYTYDYEVGDLGGYFYVVYWAPLLGFGVTWIIHLTIAKFTVIHSQIMTVLLAAITIVVFVHFAFFKMELISGWYKVPEHINWSELPLIDLLDKTHNQNDELAWQAWQEFLERGHSKPSILLEYLSTMEGEHKEKFVDLIRVRECIEALSQVKDTRVLPYLERMIQSKEFIIVEHPNGTIEHIYATQEYGKEFYAKYFGVEKDEVSRPSVQR